MAEVTVDTLNGFFKDVFADSVEWLLPKNALGQRDIAFVGAGGRTGELHSQPVVVQHEHGFTYAAPRAGAYTLEASAAGQIEEAQIEGYNLALRSTISVEAAARSVGSRQAYMRGNMYLVEAMTQSIRKRNEIDVWNGQIDLGVIGAVATDEFTITDATWAAGIWSGMEGAAIEIFDADLATQEGTFATITGVNLDTKTITMDAEPGTPDVGDRVFFKTQVDTTASWNTQIGVHAILANTGTQYGISASTYSLWKSNSVDAAGPLTFDIIQEAQARSVEKGAEEDMNLYTSPLAWKDLIGDLAALREYDKRDGNMEYTLGASSITFYGQVGRVSIKPSIFVKEGFSYLIAPSLFNRVGATDITFRLPDREDEFYDLLESAMGYQLRAYSNQTVFTRCPGKATLIFGITVGA